MRHTVRELLRGAGSILNLFPAPALPRRPKLWECLDNLGDDPVPITTHGSGHVYFIGREVWDEMVRQHEQAEAPVPPAPARVVKDIT